MNLWNNSVEIEFFKESLKKFASKEKLFYNLNGEYFAYIPKDKAKQQNLTLQSRNSLIGHFTETWAKNILYPIAKKFNLYALNNVVCEEIGLTKQSSADIAFYKTADTNQKPENIKIIFEVKMSIISNYKLENNKVICIGDYKTHCGNPSLLRSDSMLKAIGKSINIRISSIKSSHIPIVVLGNSPITENYIKKVDMLKNTGVIQSFISLNPNPTETKYIKETPNFGFKTINKEKDLFDLLESLLSNKLNYFSAMLSKQELGNIIKIASKEKSNEDIASKFLELIKE